MIASGWMTFWNIVLGIGFAAFAVVLLSVIPLGARDVMRLFSRLDAHTKSTKSTTETNEQNKEPIR